MLSRGSWREVYFNFATLLARVFGRLSLKFHEKTFSKASRDTPPARGFLNFQGIKFELREYSAGDYDDRCLEGELTDRCSLDNGDNAESYNNCSEEYSNECQNQYQDNDYSNQYEDGGGQQMNYSETKGPEILYKSSKELYKAVAKQCGISCKMTDTCR